MKKTIEIIYEDKWLVAIDKPSGLMSVAGNRKDVETAYMLVNGYLMHKYNGRVKAHVLHRLDRDTSGVLLFAKDFGVKRAMTDNWNERVVERKYVAVVDGVPGNSGTPVAEGMQRNSGTPEAGKAANRNKDGGKTAGDESGESTEARHGRIVSWLTQDMNSFMVYSSLKDNGRRDCRDELEGAEERREAVACGVSAGNGTKEPDSRAGSDAPALSYSRRHKIW